MLASSIPYKFATPWAVSASAPNYITNPIPAASITPAAGQDLGFPPATANPSGTPPNINDFNGVLFYETSWSRWLQAGGAVLYDGTFQANIGGYPTGATVWSGTTAALLWRSTADNNVTDPDTGGAGWVSQSAGRLINVQVFTATGTYTPTAGMGFCIIEAQGAGGAGGGCGSAGASNVSLGAPGSAGTYALGKFTATQIGASKAVTIGAGGVAVSASAGGAGGSTSVGTLIISPGGTGGGTFTNVPPPTFSGNGVGSGAATGGNLYSVTSACQFVSTALSANTAIGGSGQSSRFGAGGGGPLIDNNGNGAGGHGAGGSGTVVDQGGGTAIGGNGTSGIVIIYEYSV